VRAVLNQATAKPPTQREEANDVEEESMIKAILMDINLLLQKESDLIAAGVYKVRVCVYALLIYSSSLRVQVPYDIVPWRIEAQELWSPFNVLRMIQLDQRSMKTSNVREVCALR
jgi:hypothetical protein